MDDARNGRRGPRGAPSPELLALLRERYGLAAAGEARDLGGSSNLNLLLAAGRCRSVARIYRPHVTVSRLADIQRVRRALARGGVPCARPIPTREGEPWTEMDGRLIEVEEFIDHDGEMDSWESLEVGLPWLGRLHSLLRTVTVSPEGRTPLFANYLEPREARERTLEGTRRLRRWGPTRGELRLAAAAEELAQRVTEAGSDLDPLLPRQLVHGDFWDENVLLRRGRVALVMDFDFMGERARIDDLGLTLYFACMEEREDPVSDAQLRRLAGLADAYDSGLDDRLSRLERAALPVAVARQPLWSIGGWVAALDDEQAARAHAAGAATEVEWALGVVRDLQRWQAALA